MKFKPGFRLSIVDMIVIIIAISASIYFFNSARSISYLIAFVVGHFFLFCNVTRMSRIPEIIWAIFFTALAALSIKYNLLTLPIVFLASIGLTIILIFIESRKPSYHGLLWQKVNPNLETWFSENQV